MIIKIRRQVLCFTISDLLVGCLRYSGRVEGKIHGDELIYYFLYFLSQSFGSFSSRREVGG